MKDDKKLSKVSEKRVIRVYRNEPLVAASISKLVTEEDNNSKKKTEISLDELGLSQVNKKMTLEKQSVKYIFKLFPEFKFVADVVTTMTLSSIDLGAYNVRFKLGDTPIPTDINGRVMKVIASHMEKHYKITDELYDVAYECLFGTGSYAETIIPENVLDDVISSRISGSEEVGMEGDYDEAIASLLNDNKTHGFLGGGPASMESDSMNYDPTVSKLPLISITDNWNLLKSPAMSMVSSRKKVHESMGVLSGDIGLEDDLLFRRPSSQVKADVLKLENLNLRKAIGKPSVTRINTEAIIPVFLKSKPSEHLAYFILIDEEGLPVTETKEDKEFIVDIEMASGSVDFQQSDGNKTLSTAAKNLGLMDEDEPINDKIVSTFSDMLEEDIKSRLRSGLHGGLADFNNNDTLYKIMLRKTLKNIGCKLLYVPAEMLQYTALDYRANGTGISLLHDLTLIASMRASLLMSGVANEIQNNITTTIVDVTLDPNDQTPEKTFDMIKAYVLKMEENNMQDFTLDPSAINDWLTSIGVRFQISEHPKLPNTKIEFSQEETSKPDLGDKESMIEKLTKSMVMSVGLMPEILDSMQDSTFASISEANRVLMERRTYTRRKTLMSHITDKVRKLIRADESLHVKIAKVFEDNKISLRKNVLTPAGLRYNAKTKPDVNEWLIGVYADNVICQLPSQSGDDEDLSEQYGNYKDALEDRLELLLGEGVGELLGDLEEYRESALELWKNTLLRRWCTDNNYMPEADVLVQTDSVGDPLVDLEEVANDITEGLNASTAGFVKIMLKKKEEAEAKLAKIEDDIAAAKEESDNALNNIDNDGENGVDPDDDDTPPIDDEPPEEPPEGTDDDEPPEEPPEELDDDEPPEEPDL